MDLTTYENIKTLFSILLIVSFLAILVQDLARNTAAVLDTAVFALAVLIADYLLDNYVTLE